MNCDTARQWLSPYMDGELDAVRSAELEGHWKSCQACADELASYRALSQEIKSVPYHQVPSAVKARIGKPVGVAPADRGFSVLVFATGLAAGIVLMLFLWRPWSGANLLTEELVGSHVRALVGETLIQVKSSDRHTVKPWFQGKLDFSPTVIDLAQQGFPLLGGRLDYIEGRRVAALVYGRGQHVINVFIGKGLSGPSTASQDGFHVAHWRMGELDYWAVSDADDLGDFEAAFKAAAGG